MDFILSSYRLVIFWCFQKSLTRINLFFVFYRTGILYFRTFSYPIFFLILDNIPFTRESQDLAVTEVQETWYEGA